MTDQPALFPGLAPVAHPAQYSPEVLNLARLTGRRSKEAEYWAEHAAIAALWDERVIVNIDQPIAKPWCGLLTDASYRVTDVIPVRTRRYRGLDNADKRAEHEVVVVAVKTAPVPPPEPVDDGPGYPGTRQRPGVS